jgi:6-phosphogluconolactonase
MTDGDLGEVIVVEDKQALARKAASMVADELSATLAVKDAAIWVIAGGASPAEAYGVLAENYLASVDWPKVRYVMGDERCVPFDSPDCNWAQFENIFLSRISQGPDALERPQTNQSAEAAADGYEAVIKTLPAGANGAPTFDVVWLGMGPDGHTLSIFPNHPSSAPSGRLVVPVHDSPKPPAVDRISLTLKALAGTKHLVILCGGEEKADAIRQAFSGGTTLPVAKAAATVIKAGGEVTWLLDTAAASKL